MRTTTHSDGQSGSNATPFAGGDRLGTDTSFNFRPDEREANLLKAGDHVVLKLSQKSKTQE